MRFVTFTFCAVIAILLGIVPVRAEKRVALVVGNERYANLLDREQLRKAVNDARAVGDALRQIGFEVVSGENLGRQALIDKLDEVAERLSPGDTVFFFFSGHGIAVDGANYILPADVPDMTAGQVTRLKGAALAEEYITAELLRGGAQVAVVVLDACRNNPFGRAGTKGVGGEKGLQPREPPSGVFTLYAAGRGEAALDRLYDGDRDPNSVFTRALLPALTRPGLDLPALAVEVREEVTRLARSVKHEQRPAYYDGTSGERVFLAGLPPANAGGPGGGPGGGPSGGPSGRPAPPPAAPSPDEVAWSIVKDTRDPDQLRRFIEQYPASPRHREAAERLRRLPQTTAVATAVPAFPNARRYKVFDNVSDGFLNIRTGPGANTPVVAEIPAGSSDVSVGRCVAPDAGRSASWCEVQWHGHAGWASTCCMAEAGDSVRTFRVLADVSGGSLNIRQGPGPRFGVVAEIPANAADVLVGRCRLPESGGSTPWCEVKWRAYSGWASGCCMVDATTGAYARAGN